MVLQHPKKHLREASLDLASDQPHQMPNVTEEKKCSIVASHFAVVLWEKLEC
jgi:hypothetical protein